MFFHEASNKSFSSHAATAVHLGTIAARTVAAILRTGNSTAYRADISVHTATTIAHIRTETVHTAAVTDHMCSFEPSATTDEKNPGYFYSKGHMPIGHQISHRLLNLIFRNAPSEAKQFLTFSTMLRAERLFFSRRYQMRHLVLYGCNRPHKGCGSPYSGCTCPRRDYNSPQTV